MSSYKKSVHHPINRFTYFYYIRRERLKYNYSQSLNNLNKHQPRRWYFCVPSKECAPFSFIAYVSVLLHNSVPCIKPHVAFTYVIINYLNLLMTKSRLLYLKIQFVPQAVNTFHLGYKNQSVYAVSGTSRCLFLDK